MATTNNRLRKLYLELLTLVDGITLPDFSLIGEDKFKYRNIWDDQIYNMIEGNSYSFAMPSVFLQVELGDCMLLGGGMRSYPNAIIRFKICHLLLNSENAMEQNLQIFEIRDAVVTGTQNANLSNCSSLIPFEDIQDFKHGNTYVYDVSYKTNFLDIKGSQFDIDTGIAFGYLVNPTLNLNLFKNWCSGVSYVEDVNVVVYRGSIYLCKTSNSDLEFVEANWEKINQWIPNTVFEIGDKTLFQSVAYECITDNEDSVFDISKWNKITR